MLKTKFGTRFPLYEAEEQPDGWVQVLVNHENQSVRKHIREHADNPQWYVEHQDTWSGSNIRAKSWLAFMVEEYEEYFRAGQVEFVLATPPEPIAQVSVPSTPPPPQAPPSIPGTPPPPTGVAEVARGRPPAAPTEADPLKAEWREDLFIVTEACIQLEQILRSEFRARGRGLGQLVEDVSSQLPLPLIAQLHDIVRQRNPIVHPVKDGRLVIPRPTLRSRDAFREQCDQAARALKACAGRRH